MATWRRDSDAAGEVDCSTVGHGKNGSKNKDNVDREDRKGFSDVRPRLHGSQKAASRALYRASGFAAELLELCCWMFDSASISPSCRGRKVRRSLHALKHKTGPMLESIGDGVFGIPALDTWLGPGGGGFSPAAFRMAPTRPPWTYRGCRAALGTQRTGVRC